MPKANIDLPDGTKIVVEGTVDEVAEIVSFYQARLVAAPVPKKKPTKKPKPRPVPRKGARSDQ